MTIDNRPHIIFHIDFNQFFCSVAQIQNPLLRGKAFAIGRENSEYGVISTASYEARKYGIHSGMSLTECYKLYPKLIVVSLPYSYYLDYHDKFISLLKEYTNLIEVASIDEAYIDVTEYAKIKHPLIIAKEIQTRLLTKYKLPTSIGIAPTLFLAKMASDFKKPLGITVIRKKEAFNILKDLSVKDIFGIGKKTYPKLEELGIKTINDFMNINNKIKILSVLSLDFYNDVINRLTGNSRNIIDVNKHHINESISTMQTYDRRLNDEDEILLELRKLAKDVYKRLIEEKYLTKTISISLRDTSFKTITRSKTISEYTNDFLEIFDVITTLFYENYHGDTLRLLGVTYGNLIKEELLAKDYNLFTIDEIIEKEASVKKLMKNLNEAYGKDTILFGKDLKTKTN